MGYNEQHLAGLKHMEEHFKMCFRIGLIPRCSRINIVFPVLSEFQCGVVKLILTVWTQVWPFEQTSLFTLLGIFLQINTFYNTFSIVVKYLTEHTFGCLLFSVYTVNCNRFVPQIWCHVDTLTLWQHLSQSECASL